MSAVEHTAQGSVRYLPHAVAATAAVTLAPAGVVWTLVLTGLTTGFVALLAVGLVVSLLVALGGRVLWQRRPESRDLLFSDLMLWGWLRRWRMEKRLADTVALLGPDTAGVREPGDELEPEARVKALKKLVAELEAREPHTHGHSRRVARYSTMIAKKLGLPAAEVAKIRLAANLHDVGKLRTPQRRRDPPRRSHRRRGRHLRRAHLSAPLQVGARASRGVSDPRRGGG
jgi:putative nucleotidyltransferase with HDIG domain